MPKVIFELSELKNEGQELEVENIIDQAVKRMQLAGLKVLSHNYPKMSTQ